MLGLVGDSGAGKSTLCDGIVKILGPERVTAICLDDYHAYDRIERGKRGVTALHPDANHLDLMAQHMRLLRDNERIFKPVYDHTDGTFGPPEIVAPSKIVLVHGLHGLFTPQLQRIWDVSVYLDPDPDLRLQWKMKRDISKRGYTEAQVRAELEKRAPDSAAFIAPQKEKADIVISFFPPEDYARTRDNTRLNVRITLRHPIPLPDLDAAIADADARRDKRYVKTEATADGIDVLEISGAMPDAEARAIEDRMWDRMPTARHLRSDELGVFIDLDEKKRSNSLLVTQLVVTYYLVKASALALKQEEAEMARATR